MATAIYEVSGGSNSHRTLVLRDEGACASIVNSQWGRSLAASWLSPELMVVDGTAHQPEADFSSLYLPGLLLSNRKASDSIKCPELERLPVRLGSEERVLLNPLITITRFREAGADFVRVADGAIILLSSADFYAEDIPGHSALFWFHDGNAPRSLLCNQQFVSEMKSMGASGLAFRKLGNAR